MSTSTISSTWTIGSNHSWDWIPITNDPNSQISWYIKPGDNSPVLLKEKEDKNMRYLYAVYVVDPNSGLRYGFPKYKIAKSPEDAKIKAFLEAGLAAKEVDDCDTLVVALGSVRESK